MRSDTEIAMLRNDKGRSAGHERCFGGPDIESPRTGTLRKSSVASPASNHHRRPFHHRARPVAALQQRMDKRTGRPEYRDRQPCFSFDMIPSSQIDNLLVYKSPSPEIPGDFSGGFVKIVTKGIPEENSIEVGYSTGFNVRTQSGSSA